MLLSADMSLSLLKFVSLLGDCNTHDFFCSFMKEDGEKFVALAKKLSSEKICLPVRKIAFCLAFVAN